MNPNPQSQVPVTLRDYKYTDNARWTRPEIIAFQQGLFKYGKDFGQVAKQIRSKMRQDCVNFYHLWKKICSGEYEKVRNVWKKREGAFTLDLLKTVPPPMTNCFTSPHIEQSHQNLNLKTKENPKNKVNDLSNMSKLIGTGVDKQLTGFEFIIHQVPALPEITMVNNVPIDLVNGLSFQSHEEYPCKICGK